MSQANKEDLKPGLEVNRMQSLAKAQIVSLSLSLRVLVNSEALNMAESVGNYTRHRKAPVVFSSGQVYSIVYVPAVSGESIAHAYQQILAKISLDKKLSVAKADLNGYFMKFADSNIIDKYYAEDLARVLGMKLGPKEKMSEILKKRAREEVEEAILKTSVVADVGGFLYTDLLIKRTAAIRFSYLLPAIDALESGGASIVPQLHVRYTPTAERREQALFYVESGSALYTLTSQLLVSDIGRTSEGKILSDYLNRVEASIDALIALVDGMLFGAKRSRYLPQWSVRSLAVSVSRGPVEFVVSPGLTKEYIRETYERAIALTSSIGNMEISIYSYNGEGAAEPSPRQDIRSVMYEKSSNHTDAMGKAKRRALELAKKITAG